MENKLTISAISDQEPSHYCLSREIKAYCYDLSSTEKTCYTLPEKIGGKRCTEGWKEIPFIETVISIPSSQISDSNKIHCNNQDCV